MRDPWRGGLPLCCVQHVPPRRSPTYSASPPDWTCCSVSDDRRSSAHWAGFALAVAGCSLAAAGAGRFVLRRTTLHPTGEPAHFIVNGPHGWSRNPMYLSLTVVCAGVALALGRAWPLALIVLPWASMNWIRIPYEEARLRETFGEDYADYCRRVRRWI
ncbi:MAG: isoprenylcysteine carboxylmethyltransferase family protein [Bryobacteraceae bacterium]